MDREKVRRNIKLYKKIAIGHVIGLFVFNIILLFNEDTNNIVWNIYISIGMLAIFLGVYAILLLLPCLIYNIRNRNKDIKIEGYNYEPPYSYSPVIASYLLNNNIEALVDARAVQLNLLLNGYIDLENNKYIHTSKSSEDLSSNEIIVYNNINKNHSTIEEKFLKQAYCDMEKDNLIKKRKPLYQIVKTFGIYSVFAVIYYLLTAILCIAFKDVRDGNILSFLITLPGYLVIILGFPVSIFLIKYSLNKPYKRTKLGKEHAKEWKKFKNFLEDYTLINEREEEHYKLLGEYIPYAMSLGVADKIEKEIFKEQEKIDKEYDKLKKAYELNK